MKKSLVLAIFCLFACLPGRAQTKVYLKQPLNSDTALSHAYGYANTTRSVLAFTTSVTNTTASGTSIQWTKTAGGTQLKWVSAPLAAPVTISGTVTMNVWAFEDNAAANATVAFTVKRFAGGTEGSSLLTDSAFGSELGTSVAVKNWTAAPTSTAFVAGDRIVLIGDIVNVGTMAGSHSVTLDYGGKTNAADGDSWVQFNENLTFATEPEFIQSIDCVAALTTSIPCTFAGVNATGNTFIVFSGWQTATPVATFTDSASNTYTGVTGGLLSWTPQGNPAKFQAFYVNNITGGSAITVTEHFDVQVLFSDYAVSEYAGLSTSAVPTATINTGSSNTAITPSITPTITPVVLFSAFAEGQAISSFPANQVSRVPNEAAYDYGTTSSASQSMSVTFVAPTDWAGMIFQLTPVTASPVTPVGTTFYGKFTEPGGGDTKYPIVTVCSSLADYTHQPCNLPVAIYTDSTMGMAKPNPFRGDLHGNFDFSAPAGVYVVSAGTPFVPGYSFKANLITGGSGGGCSSPTINCTFGTPFASMSAYAQAEISSFNSTDAAAKFGLSATNQDGIFVLYDGTSDGLSPGEALNAVAACGVTIPTSAGCGGVNGYAYVNASSTLAKAWGVSGFWQKDGAGTLTDAYGIWATKGIKNTGTVTRNSGVFIDDQHGLGTTNYGLRIADQGTTSDAHAILSGGQETHTYGSTTTTAQFPFEFFAPTTGDLGDGTGASLRLALQDENGQGLAVTNALCVTNCGYLGFQINMANQGGFTLWDGGSNYPSLHLGIVAGEASLSGGPGSTGDIGARVDNTGFARLRMNSPIYESTEAAAPSGVAGRDLLWGDSTAHKWKIKENNGTTLTVAGISGATTIGNCVQFAAGPVIVDSGAGCGGGAGGANVALSNLAGVGINTTLLPGAINTVALGSNALSFTNLFLGTVANQTGSFDTSALTANRSMKIPNAASTLVQDCPSTANQFMTQVLQSTGACTKAQPTLANIAAGASPAGLFNFAASTIRIPEAAGFVASAVSTLGLDTTSNAVHSWINAADAILAGWASAPAGSKCAQSSGTKGLLTEAAGACGTWTDSSTSTGTNKTLSQEGTGNVITVVATPWMRAAGCNNSTAAPAFDLPTTQAPTPSCLTGSNVQKATLDYDDSVNEFSQFDVALPHTWTGAIDINLKWLVTASGGSNAVKWTVATACSADAATYDTAFNAAQTITTNVAANSIQTVSSQATVTVTGCAVDNVMNFKIGRDTSDTFTGTARLIGAQVVLRHTGK